MNELKEATKRVIGIELSDIMLELFKIYYKELLEWNKKMNLISLRDEQRVVTRHFLDSLEATQFITNSASVIDIGSGAGFPGVPIKIVRKDVELTLLEPKLKRFNFLTHLVKTLNASGADHLPIKIYRERAEDFNTTAQGRFLPMLQPYDVILARSVGKLKWLTTIATPILALNGRIITYKGSRFCDEFKEVQGGQHHWHWEILARKPRTFCAGTIVVLKRK